MLKHKESYLGYKQTYTSRAYDRYGAWLDKFEEVVGKEEEQITVEDILKFRLWLQVRYAEKSVEYAMTILRNYFRFLKLKDIVCLNYELIRSPKGRAVSHQAVEPEDYQKILKTLHECMPENELRYLQTHIMIRILGETGVRVSELTSIMIDDINLNKCGSIIQNKKNKDVRWIYWSQKTNEMIQKYLPAREYLKRGTRALFVGSQMNDKAISTRQVERIIKACCEKAGVSNIVPHSFRHGLAHNVLEKGGNVADVQKMLGHRSPLSSMKYLQYSDREHAKRAKRFLIETA